MFKRRKGERNEGRKKERQGRRERKRERRERGGEMLRKGEKKTCEIILPCQ